MSLGICCLLLSAVTRSGVDTLNSLPCTYPSLHGHRRGSIRSAYTPQPRPIPARMVARNDRPRQGKKRAREANLLGETAQAIDRPRTQSTFFLPLPQCSRRAFSRTNSCEKSGHERDERNTKTPTPPVPLLPRSSHTNTQADVYTYTQIYQRRPPHTRPGGLPRCPFALKANLIKRRSVFKEDSNFLYLSHRSRQILILNDLESRQGGRRRRSRRLSILGPAFSVSSADFYLRREGPEAPGAVLLYVWREAEHEVEEKVP